MLLVWLIHVNQDIIPMAANVLQIKRTRVANREFNVLYLNMV